MYLPYTSVRRRKKKRNGAAAEEEERPAPTGQEEQAFLKNSKEKNAKMGKRARRDKGEAGSKKGSLKRTGGQGGGNLEEETVLPEC